MTASPCPDNLHDEAASSPMQSALFGMIFEDGDASSGRRAEEEAARMNILRRPRTLQDCGSKSDY